MRSYTSNDNFLQIGDDDRENFDIFHRDSTDNIVASRHQIVQILKTNILSVSCNTYDEESKLDYQL